MTIEQLREIIQKRIHSMDKKYEKAVGYDLCSNFLAHNSMDKVEDFTKIDIYELSKCYLYVHLKDKMSIEEIKDYVETLKGYFYDLDYEHISNLFGIIYYIVENEQREKILKCVKEKSSFKLSSLIAKVDCSKLDSQIDLTTEQKEKEFKRLIKNLRLLQNDFDVIKVIETIIKYNERAMQDVFEMLEAQQKMKEEQADIEEAIKKYSGMVKGKSIERAKKQFYKMNYSTKDILAIYHSISDFVTQENQKEARFTREQQREINGYETALQELEGAMSQREITNARAIVKTVKNEDVKKAFLETIYSHNESYYHALEERLNDLKKNSLNAYLAKLKQAGIIVDSNEGKQMMHHTIEELEEVLTIVTKFPFMEDEIKIVLKTTSIMIARKIKEYVDKGYLDPNFTCDNIKLWDKNTNSLRRIESLFEGFQQFNLNPQIFCNSYEVLLDSNQCVMDNLQDLQEYNAIRYLKNASDLSFIAIPHIVERIDQMIECGVLEYLTKDMSLLNSENLDRLYLLREMHMEVSSLEELREVLFSRRFIVPDEEIDEYITEEFQPSENNNFDHIDLEKARLNPWTYSIGGILVSSHKVDRLKREGNSTSHAVLKGLKISSEEYQEMLEFINEKCKRYV